MLLIMQTFIEPHKRYRVGRLAKKNIISSTSIYIILYIFEIFTIINQNYFITTPAPPAPRRTRNNRRKWIARREESSEEKTTLENQLSCWETRHLQSTCGAAPVAGKSDTTWEITETGQKETEPRRIGREKKDGKE